MSANERRNDMLMYLSAVRTASREDLAERYGVSLRTIDRDIEELTLSAPIYTQTGPGGGIRVMDGWYASRHYLSGVQEALLKELMKGLQTEEAEIMHSILTEFAKPQNKKGKSYAERICAASDGIQGDDGSAER